MENLGETIKALRLEKGISVDALAKKLGVSNASVSFWENNVNEPKASYIKKLAVEFGVSADCLLGLDAE